jgi:glycosyltransferase involved in cell wall biosynthesis
MRIIAGNVQSGELEDSCIDRIPVQKLNYLGRNISIVSDFLALLEFWIVVKKFKPDIIYSHTFKAGILSRLVPTRAQIIHTFHGHHLNNPEIQKWKLKLWIRIESVLAKRTQILVATGRQVAEDLLRVGIGSQTKFYCLNPYVKDIKKLERNKALATLNIYEDSRIKILWMGRFVSVKRPEVIIEIANKFPSCLFLISGSGPYEFHLNELKYDNIKFLGWRDPQILFSVADVLISTSTNEGLPNTLIEASLAAVPTVSTNVGSVSEIVLHKKTGFLTENIDEDFFGFLNLLISDSKLRHRLGRAARKFALMKFSQKNFKKNQLEIFSLLI